MSVMDENCDPRVYLLGSDVKFLATLKRRLPYEREEGFYHQILITVASLCCAGPVATGLTDEAMDILAATGTSPADSWHSYCEVCASRLPVTLDLFSDMDVSVFYGGGEYGLDAYGSTDFPRTRKFVNKFLEDLHPNPLEVEVKRELLLAEIEAQCSVLLEKLGWVQDEGGSEYWHIPADSSPARSYAHD